MAYADKRKPIIELDKPNGKIKQYWPSAKDAAEFYGFNVVIISYNVNKRTKQAKGHYFRFATPEEIEIYKNIQISVVENDIKVAPEPAPAFIPPDIPVEVISAPDPNEQPLNESAFEKMLKESKKKFNENSE